MSRYGIGLDVGATKTHGVLVDADGQVLAEVRESTGRGDEGVVETCASVSAALLATPGVDPAALWPVGVGVPGLVDVERGTVTHAVNLGIDGTEMPLRDRLSDRLGAPVLVENDVNAAALGAAALVAGGPGKADLVYLSIGTGLAAGLVLGGSLRRGVHGAAGEIGHIPVDPAGELCGCGQRGCLERVASGAALAAAWPTNDGTQAATAVFAAAAAGDVRAGDVRDRFAAAIAAAVLLLCLTVDVESVVLGGGVAQVGEPLRAAVAEALVAVVADSPVLASLGLPDRLSVVPADLPVATVGAALLGRPPTHGGDR